MIPDELLIVIEVSDVSSAMELHIQNQSLKYPMMSNNENHSELSNHSNL